MSIFDFFGLNKKNVSAGATAPVEGANALLSNVKTSSVGEGSVATAPVTPTIDFFSTPVKSPVKIAGTPQFQNQTLTEYQPTTMERIKDAVSQFGQSLKGGLAQFGFGTAKGLTGPIGQKIVEGNAPGGLQEKLIEGKGSEIGLKDILGYVLGPQSVADIVGLIPQKYKDIAQGWLEKKNTGLEVSEKNFYENNPDLLPKYTTGLVTAIKNRDTKQLGDPSYRSDLIGRGLGQMLPSLALVLATKNPALGLASFFPQQVQEAYDDVKNDENIKLDDSQKQSYALVLGSITTAIENMSFGVVAKPFLKSMRNEITEAVLKSPLKAGLLQVLESFGAEGTEEITQRLTTDVMAKFFGSTRNLPSMEELANTFLEAGIGSIGAGGFGGATEFASQRKTNKKILSRPVEGGERFQEGGKQTTSNILKDIMKESSKEEISRKQIENTLNRQQYKEPEKRIVREVLDSFKGDTINRNTFEKEVNARLMDLGQKKSSKYADYNSLRDEQGYEVDGSYSRIYETPFTTKGAETHFNRESDNYFAHSRVEDMGDTNRIVEIQSDLFQRKRYLSEGRNGIESQLKGFLEDIDRHKKGIESADTMLRLMDEGVSTHDIIAEMSRKGLELPNVAIEDKSEIVRYKKRLEDMITEKTTEAKTLQYMKDNDMDDSSTKLVQSYFREEENKNFDIKMIKALDDILGNQDFFSAETPQQQENIWKREPILAGIHDSPLMRGKMDREYIQSQKTRFKNLIKDADTKMDSYMKDIKKVQQIPPSVKKQHLEDYANRRHERVVREELTNAYNEGKKYIQLPDPKTIAKIEGYLGESGSLPEGYNEGDVVDSPMGEGRIVFVGGDYYTVVPLDAFNGQTSIDEWKQESFDNYIRDLKDNPGQIDSDEAISFVRDTPEMMKEFENEFGYPPEGVEMYNEKEEGDMAKFIVDHSDVFEDFFMGRRYGDTESTTRRNVESEMEEYGYWPVISENGTIYLLTKDEYDRRSESVAKGNPSDGEDRYEHLSEDQRAVVDFYKNKLLPYAEKYAGPVIAYQTVDHTKSTAGQATEQDIAKAKALLPEATYKTVEQIVNPKTGLPAYGSYLDGMITFAKTLTKTTAYHEVFHAYFDMFTDPKTQREILEIVKKEQKIKTDIGAEEWLAETFAEHAIAIEAGQDTKGNYKILDFLDELRAKVKAVFGKGDKIKQLYKDIMEGKRPEDYQKRANDFKLKRKFQEKEALDSKLEDDLENERLDKVFTEKGMEYLDSVEITMKDIEDMFPEKRKDFADMTEQELGEFYVSDKYDRLSEYERMLFDKYMNKKIFPDPMRFADKERQKFIDRIAKNEYREQRIGKVGNQYISAEKKQQQSLEVDRERESIIESLMQYYNLEDTSDGYDMYAQLRDVPISQIKYKPRKGEYISSAEKYRRQMEKIDKLRTSPKREVEVREPISEEKRKIASIQGAIMISARNKGKDVQEAKALIKILNNNRAEVSPQEKPIDLKLSDKFYKANQVTEAEAKEALKSKNAENVREGALNRWKNTIIPVGTQLENISKSVYGRIKKYDYDIMRSGQRDMQKSLPFLDGVSALRKSNMEDYFNLRLALSNRDNVTAQQILQKHDIPFPRDVLDGMYAEGEEAGFNIGFLEDYFPRVVKDARGLLMAVKKSPERSYIKDAINAITEARGVKALTIEEEAEIINSLLMGREVNGVKLGSPNMKERSIELVKKDLLQFYYPPEEALTRYLGSMREAIEMGKLFGNSGEFDTSLGLFIAKEVADGQIDYEDAEKVRELLEAKFSKARSNPFVNRVKTIGYTASLGSFSSSITQLGDLSFSLIENGIWKTLKSLGKSVTGKAKIDMKEFGLEDIGQEYKGEGFAKKFLSVVLKGTGFTWMDRRGKETYLNSTFDRLQKLAKNNDQKLQKELMDYFGEKMANQVMADLKAGKDSDDVRTYLFLKLSNVQPLTSTEMPPMYNKNATSRIFYMLKTFSLKQLDYVWKKGVQEAIDNPKTGIPKLAKMLFIIMLMNGLSDELKNITLGRKYNSLVYRILNGDDIGPALSSLFRDNLFKIFGLTKYSIYEAKTDGVDKAFSNIFLSIPPLQVPGNIISDLIGMIKGKTDFSDLKSIQMIPWIGKPLYRRAGKGGASQEKSLSKENKAFTPSRGGI